MPVLPFKLNQHRRRHLPKQKHKPTNSLGALLRSWREHDASLRQRGSRTTWLTPLATLAALTLQTVFRLALLHPHPRPMQHG